MREFETAIALLGGPSAAARALGCSAQAVIFWRDGKRRLPAEMCPKIERLTGVSCEQLRPDVEWEVLRGHGMPASVLVK